MTRIVALGLGALALVLLTGSSASAHALLESSQPADGALLEEAPGEVVLDFTEEPDLSLSRVQILDTEGRPVETGEPQKDRADPRRLRVPVTELPDGSYTVSWRVLSTVDGHVTTGAFAFGVGVDEVVATPGQEGSAGEVPRPSVLSVVGRWGFYWSLALLLSAALLALVIFRNDWRPAAPALIGAWALGAVGLAALLLAESGTADVSVGELLASQRGRVVLLRAAGLAAAGVAMLLAIRKRGAWPMVALGSAAAAAMLIQAYAGHAGGARSMRELKVGIQWVHLVASGIWVGGLAWLLIGTRGRAAPGVGSSVARFSTMAAVAVAAVAVTGGMRAVDEVGSFGALVGSTFGLTVLGKVALFVPLVALGALNRYRTVPALRRGEPHVRLLRRLVAGEVALAAGIFGVTGVMAGLPPPGYAPTEGAVERVTVSGSDFGTTVKVRLVVTPGTPGPNRFEVALDDYDSGEPISARRVRLRFSLPERSDLGGSELDLTRTGKGLWGAQGSNLSVEGKWRVGVLIEQAADSLEVPLEVRIRPPEQDITVSRAPGQPTLYTIALPGGLSVQGYVDPGEAGDNEVHFTFFDPDGGEQRVEDARATITLGSEDPIQTELRTLSTGHFVAAVDLEPGTWRFRVEAAAPDGTPLSAYFEQRIE